MVFYVGAALGKIGEAIQADSTERRAIKIRAEERAEDRTNLILDKALDIGTQDYYKRKQENVFGFNMPSIIRVQVKKANTTFETPNPISFELHNSPVSFTISFESIMSRKLTFDKHES